jgi:RimJ/RimL family protein N-acetyltransferase
MELETRRLLLRPLRDDDAPAMARALNNFEVVKNLALVPFPHTLEMAQGFIVKQRSFDPRGIVSAITFRCAPDELIGMVSYGFHPAPDRFEFGYWLRQCCWNMGIMSEASTGLVDYAFATAKLDVLQSGYHTDNPNSGRILHKLGFVETHIEMNLSVAQGKDVPTAKLRLTRESWLAQQKSRAA